MLCVKLRGYSRACGSVTGGISDIAVFDPSDIDLTQAAPVNGAPQPYTAIAARAGAGDTPMFVVNFQQDEAEWTYTQSKTGCATKWEHEFVFQLPDNSQTLTQFQQALDAAGCCCGVGFAMRMNSGKIFFAGEKYVNAEQITRFTIAQDGTEGGSGKLFDDFNGANIHLKGSYNRNLYEYTGAWSTITAMSDVSGS